MNGVIAACFVLFVLCIATSQALSLDYRGDDEPTGRVEKRYYTASSCRRCMYNEDTWSCMICFSRPGSPIPFYGGYRKRSYQGSVAAEDKDMLPYQGEGSVAGFEEEKRGVMDYCRCCTASSPYSSYCCARCNITPYYNSLAKRGYDTSFVPMGMNGAGLCSMCCNPDTFDYYCCFYSCGDRKRK